MRIDTRFACLLVILIFGFIISPTESRSYGDLYPPPTLASQADRVLNVPLGNQADLDSSNGVHPQVSVVPSNIGRGGLYPLPTLAN
ncbi:hypothetical protein V6N13_147408 [Hibiscus sabdariffa]|uniref:Secreted protein n=1 Tax=Hibiscus sabdariffa TaxID=183260 RepID=A0ABR2TVP2_9ROSI